MSQDLMRYSDQTFEDIKHINEYGQEYWLARELQTILGYNSWRRFSDAIERAKLACKNSGYEVDEQFADAVKTSPMPNGGVREIEDFALSRYACYLIVMNGDPRKEIIAIGQTYFAVKTRQQELIENYEELSEDQKRLAIRNEIKRHNIALADAAHDAGVIEQKDYLRIPIMRALSVRRILFLSPKMIYAQSISHIYLNCRKSFSCFIAFHKDW